MVHLLGREVIEWVNIDADQQASLACLLNPANDTNHPFNERIKNVVAGIQWRLTGAGANWRELPGLMEWDE